MDPMNQYPLAFRRPPIAVEKRWFKSCRDCVASMRAEAIREKILARSAIGKKIRRRNILLPKNRAKVQLRLSSGYRKVSAKEKIWVRPAEHRLNYSSNEAVAAGGFRSLQST